MTLMDSTALTPTEYSRLTEGFDPIGITQLETRLSSYRNGFEPVPVAGGTKGPLILSWPTIIINETVIAGWGNRGQSTGIRTATTPAFDIDIRNEAAAMFVEGILRQCLGDDGKIIVRIGLPPKRVILVRTDKPFTWLYRKFAAPDGSAHLIEVRGIGQQVLIAGPHETGNQYVWLSGASPVNTLRSELPYVDEEKARTILELCADELKAQFGWTDLGNSSGGGPKQSGDRTFLDSIRGSFNLDTMTPGTDVNETIWRAVGSMMCHGVPMDEVVGELIQRAMDVAPGPDWTPEVQRIELESMCMRTALSKPELEHLLTEKRRQQLDGLRQEGYKHFKVSFNRYGAYFRPDTKDPPTGDPPTGGDSGAERVGVC